MNTKDQSDWLQKHIPHRVRAALARVPLQEDLLNHQQYQSKKKEIEKRCEGDAIWEGRLAATRWLIEFIGVSAKKNGQPKLPSRHSRDARIDDLGGKIFDLNCSDARVLAKIWLGCSQGSSHATHASGHPPVNEKEISKALKIVMKHLDKQLYSGAGQTIASFALQPNP